MDEQEKVFRELAEAYEKKFGESIGIQESSFLGFEDMIPAIRKCLETNTPYEYPSLPDGCIA